MRELSEGDVVLVGDVIHTSNMRTAEFPVTRVTKTRALSSRSDGYEFRFQRYASFNMSMPVESPTTTRYKVTREAFDDVYIPLADIEAYAKEQGRAVEEVYEQMIALARLHGLKCDKSWGEIYHPAFILEVNYADGLCFSTGAADDLTKISVEKWLEG